MKIPRISFLGFLQFANCFSSILLQRRWFDDLLAKSEDIFNVQVPSLATLWSFFIAITHNASKFSEK